jgi:hypothetical protein
MMRFLERLFGTTKSRSDGVTKTVDPRAREQEIGPKDFGPFGAVFSQDCAYLSFLGMRDAKVQSTLATVSEALRSTDDAHPYIGVMLQGRNWRPHLVASVAVLLSPDRVSYASALWRTFDYGSWVAPQLAVVLYLSDPEFGREARRRIVRRCPVTESWDLDSVLEGIVRSKNIASLLRVVSLLPSETNWVASQLEQKDVQTLIEADSDACGEIVQSWLEGVRSEFAKFGRDLNPAELKD